MHDYLSETKMLDFSAPTIQKLIAFRGWRNFDEFNKIKQIYNFVRDEIKFGYNESDRISASRVLKDGFGQCNTKGTLFMALLRSVGVPCRIHGFTIDKKLQKGAMSGLVYKKAPDNIFHSWVEVLYEGVWYELEAFILDIEYLSNLQKRNSDCQGAFCGYGVAVKDFKNPQIEWNANNTYIQSEGINNDFGVYDSPDELLKEHGQEMSKCKEFFYKHIGRRLMNRNVKRVRKGKNYGNK
ncbi:MAG: transglutaminase family protein [Clostridia bacterium]|nr:transglutaminase family protein [Clostridia bacterium]